jgi:hypothetical protein
MPELYFSQYHLLKLREYIFSFLSACFISFNIPSIPKMKSVPFPVNLSFLLNVEMLSLEEIR